VLQHRAVASLLEKKGTATAFKESLIEYSGPIIVATAGSMTHWIFVFKNRKPKLLGHPRSRPASNVLAK
jgi:hypothetical protein